MIRIEGVSHRLPTPAGVTTALQDIDLTIEKGEAVALMGANGSGKSALCRCLNGLTIPEKGTVRVDGLSTRDSASAGKARLLAGMVFQDPSQQLVTWSVEEEVAFGLENLRLPAPEIDSVVDRALREWELRDLRGRHPLRLSGGQMAKVALAAVMAMTPSYLVVDEPTSLLDTQGRATLLHAISQVRIRGDVGLVWVTQFPEEVALFDRLVVMSEGRVVADAPPGHLLGDLDRLGSWGLKAPPAAILASALRRRGIGISEGVFLIRPLLAELESMGLRAALVSDAGELRPQGAARERAGACIVPSEGAVADAEWPPSAPLPGAAPVNGETYGPEGVIGRSEGVSDPAEGRRLALSMCGVSCGYPGGGEVLRDIFAEVEAGKGLGLIGRSGSGKSTFILTASGALRQSRGIVTRMPGSDKRVRVGLVTQLPEEGFCAPTVADEVGMALQGQGLDAKLLRSRVERALEMVGLDCGKVWTRSPFSLSEGEKKKVALAAAMAPENDILLLDEPIQGLDGVSEGKVLRAVRRQLGRGRAAVVASHNGDFLLCATDVLIALEGGVVVDRGDWTRFLHGDSEAARLPGGQLVAAVRWAGYRPPSILLSSVEAAMTHLSERFVETLTSFSVSGAAPDPRSGFGPQSGRGSGKTP